MSLQPWEESSQAYERARDDERAQRVREVMQSLQESVKRHGEAMARFQEGIDRVAAAIAEMGKRLRGR